MFQCFCVPPKKNKLKKSIKLPKYTGGKFIIYNI